MGLEWGGLKGWFGRGVGAVGNIRFGLFRRRAATRDVRERNIVGKSLVRLFWGVFGRKVDVLS